MLNSEQSSTRFFSYILFSLLLTVNINKAQSLPKDYNDVITQYSVSNPDVYTFEKYNLSPVNHYVGKQDVSIPIYTIKTGGIEYPLSLQYNTGGIKVDQLASDVGLGWSLSRAIITRIVNQENDFDNTGSLTSQSDYPSHTEEQKNANSEAFVDLGYTGKVGYFLQKERNQKIDLSHKYVDFLPDIYKFYSNGSSTSFFFNDINTPIEINPKGTKITAIASKTSIPTNKWGYLSSGPGGEVYGYYPNLVTKDFFTIVILTNDGIKYTFSDCDLSYVEQFRVGNQNGHGLENWGHNISPAQISAWHITKIEDTNTGKKIDFIYENTSSNPNDYGLNHSFYFDGAQKSYSYSTIPPNQSLAGCHYYAPWTNYENNFLLSGSARIDVQKKRLKKIIFDEGQISFNYNHEGIGSASGIGRPDIYNGDFLTQIYLKDNNLKTIKSFNLNYSAFESNYNVGEFNPEGQINPFRYKRLKLISFEEVGKPSYKFSYEESIKLPPVNSFSVDFAGYFNNSPDVVSNSDIITNRRSPKLYYYPNQFEKSLLPFPVSGMSYTTIPGYFNREANDYAKAWSLNKIEYPTGGYSQYFYELNDFEIFGQTIKGGGIRIAKQILNDGEGNLREINYTYKKPNGGSSGTMPTIPYFGHPTFEFFNVDEHVEQDDFDNMRQFDVVSSAGTTTNISDWKLSDKANLNADITSNAFVEYSRTVEKEINNGWKEYLYTSNNLSDFQNKYFRAFGYYSADIISSFGVGQIRYCMDKFMIANSGFASNIFTDNSYKRGKLLEENIFNESNQIVKKTKIDYTDFLISNSYGYHQGFTKPLYTQSEEHNLTRLITAGKKYKIAQFLPTKKTVSLYDALGQESKTIADFTYNPNGLLKTNTVLDSKGDINIEKYYYPTDVLTTNSLPGEVLTSQDKATYDLMSSAGKNNIATPIQIENYTNATLKNTNRRIFNVFDTTSNIVLPQTLKFSKGNNAFQNQYVISSYESGTGNPTELSRENGKKTVFIWGYNKNKLIARLENISLSTISASTITSLQNASNLDIDNCKTSSCKEEQLRTQLNNLRILYPNAMITTYTYDPLIGVTSTTDERGRTIYYEYDQYNRLIMVKDHDGNIVSENKYNYKN